MRIRHLRIRLKTDQGPHGADITFPDGLVILRADNTSGKSTCFQSILVALGLEAMLSVKRRELPLQPVMSEELFSQSEENPAKVIESDVYLEVENKNRERIVVHRTVKGTRNKNLITVTKGPALSNPSRNYIAEDFFVSQPGAAIRESGFHNYLSTFLGWRLPYVQTYEGRQVPLYIETIFPYFFVEQKRGWASLSPPIPTHFRIRDPHRRAIEFLLKLDASEIADKRLELNNRKRDLETRWSALINELQAIAQNAGGILKKLPFTPVAHWPPDPSPVIQIPQGSDSWVTFDDFIEQQKNRLKELASEEIPLVNEVTDISNDELVLTENQLREKELFLSRYLNSLEIERAELNSIQQRLDSLEVDIQRNKDVRTLQNLGSSIATNVSVQKCPTCHQQIEDSLLPLALDQNVMTIDDNISFLEQQRRTFVATLQNTQSVIEARERQVQHIRQDIASDRAKIRTLRRTLISDDRLPSMESIRERIELETSLTRNQTLLEQFHIRLERLDPLASEWFEIQRELKNLPLEDVSANDKDKLSFWNRSLRNQIAEYDFRSLQVDEIEISRDTYMPVHEGFDLNTNISASDFIRIIWAYLNGLIEVSRNFETNHPGLLVFDEPRQQSTKDLSFAALLKQASKAANYNNQVIFGTSERDSKLKEILKDIPHEYISFNGRIIQPL